MKLTELFLSELEREAARSRKALEQMPEGQADWKPHDKSMAFGYLAELVATMPGWLAMQIAKNEFDVAPKGPSEWKREPLNSRDDYLRAHDKAVAGAREALRSATDEHLHTPWRLLAGGNVVAEAPRHEMMRDTLAHLAHHRGQMTVYLRMTGAKVPALYGPSADDKSFG
jgi:uncharacterized damage-inducible protein DinB